MAYFEENNYKGNISELDKYEDVILNDFEKKPPLTITIHSPALTPYSTWAWRGI
jgi:hypothetical protein